MKAKTFDRKPLDYKVFICVAYIVVGLFALAGVLPFYMLLTGSFTSESWIINYGYSLWPGEFSLEAYKAIFKTPEKIINAYATTTSVTLVGTSLSVFLSAMAAYVLQYRDFEWRNKLTYFIYFTTLFSGGLAPWYMLMMSLGMKNNFFALVIPNLFTVFNILILRNYIKGIPYEITESAKIDGANDLVIFLKLIFPLSKPALATIALFAGLTYWNSWYNCMLFISNDKMYTLQYYLYNMLNNAAAMKELMAGSGTVAQSAADIPGESAKLAMTMIATGPILLLYPFVQKFFIKGITIGAVKG